MEVAMEDRKKYIGGSDACRIISGDWIKLWEEKTGRTEPEDLSKKLAVQIGIATEPVNIKFLEYETDSVIQRGYDIPPNEHHEFMRSHCDGIIMEGQHPGIICECKHTYENNTFEKVAEYYYPQLQHYMMHSMTEYMYLSVIFGNSRHEHAVIDWDHEYQKRLFKLEKAFWLFVTTDTKPSGFESDLPEPPKNIALNGMTVRDMSDNGKWKTLANTYNTLKPLAKNFDECKKTIRGLVPDDCRKAEGAGIVVTRNKKNILTIKETDNGK
tara:strand:- start:47 stop:853 length:807 start_codon:yes stop_codon:yes gene_type:complete